MKAISPWEIKSAGFGGKAEAKLSRAEDTQFPTGLSYITVGSEAGQTKLGGKLGVERQCRACRLPGVGSTNCGDVLIHKIPTKSEQAALIFQIFDPG